MLVIKFRFNICLPDTGIGFEVTVNGRGKSVADARRDARKQVTNIKKNLKVFEILVDSK